MRGNNSKGSVLVEFIISFPIMIFLIFVTVDFSTYFQNKHITNNLSSSGVLVPISIIQQKINDSYGKNGGDIKDIFKEISISEVFKQASSLIFNVFSMASSKSKAKISCIWSVAKKVKDSNENDEIKFYQERIDSENGGADSAVSAINKSNILCDIVSDGAVIILEVFLQYSDDKLPYVKKWEWINRWKNFKSLSKKALDNVDFLDCLLN